MIETLSKLNIESEQTVVVNRTKNYDVTLFFFKFPSILNKKVGTCPELSRIFKTLPLCANYGGASD